MSRGLGDVYKRQPAYTTLPDVKVDMLVTPTTLRLPLTFKSLVSVVL